MSRASPPGPGRRRVVLSRLQPEARHQLGRALATWTALSLATMILLVALVVWHLVRRGRLIRARLGSPRKVGLLDWDREPPEGQSS